MKIERIVILVLTIAFVVTIGVAAYKRRSELPVKVFMTDAEAYTFIEEVLN